MSSCSPTSGVPAGRKVVQIRPAVPLIYERRETSKTVQRESCQSTSNNVAKTSAKDRDSSEQVTNPANKTSSNVDFGRNLQLREDSKEKVTSYIGELCQDSQETEQISEVSAIFLDKHRMGAEEEAQQNAETTPKDLTLVKESSPISSEPSFFSRLNPSNAKAAINLSKRSLEPFSETLSNFGQTPAVLPGWMMSPYDIQAQPQFAHGWFRGHEMNSVGGLPPPTPSMSVDGENVPIDPKFVDHILSSFNDDKYADLRLVISHEKAQFEEATFSLHRVLVFRSETLRTLIDLSSGNHGSIDTKLELKITLCDRFITPDALESALRTCYGQTASASLLSQGCDMQETLASVAAGHLFKLEEVALQAFEKIRKILNWENLENAISFGLESCPHRCRSAEAALLQPFAYSKSDGDLFLVNCARFVLDFSLDFMIASFPNNWVFDSSARPLPIVDRLPVNSKTVIPQGRKSGLSRIQFGQRLPEPESHLTDRNTLISSIILSIPTNQLMVLVWASIPSMIGQLPQVIAERENRRLAALNSDVPSDQRRLCEEKEWYWVGFEEFISPDEEGMQLLWKPVSIYLNEEEAENRDEVSQGQVQG